MQFGILVGKNGLNKVIWEEMKNYFNLITYFLASFVRFHFETEVDL